MAEEEKKAKNIDIWLVLVIILMVLTIGGGLYITGQAMLSRLDSIDVKMRSQNQRIEAEIFSLRKQVQDVELLLKKMHKAQQPASPPAEPATPPAK